LAQQVQPGQPTEATWELNNPHGAQPLQFILHVSGNAPVSDVTLEIDGVDEVLVPVTLQPGSMFKYSGGAGGIVYDRNWNQLEEVALDTSMLRIGPGPHQVRFGCRFQSADQPEVKIEFRTVGEAETVAKTDRDGFGNPA
jgi:hypothetical protein